jgi:dihydrofolate synthase/folylpolyglutamate synthase
VSAIVTVDFDHVAVLGPTLRAIAMEKAGIARAGRPLVSGVEQPEAIDAIRAHCTAISAEFVDARGTPLPPGLRLPLDGAHQRANARVALAVFTAFAPSIGVRSDADAMLSGFGATRWAGRLQMIPGEPPTLLDGAHNPAGAAALAAYLATRSAPKSVLVFAAMDDKDVRGLLAPLVPHLASVVTTRASVLRAADPGALASLARSIGLEAVSRPDPAVALATARALAGRDGLVLVAGSLYLVGTALAALEGGGAPGPVSM